MSDTPNFPIGNNDRIRVYAPTKITFDIQINSIHPVVLSEDTVTELITTISRQFNDSEVIISELNIRTGGGPDGYPF